jgi:hypothetical protein
MFKTAILKNYLASPFNEEAKAFERAPEMLAT